MDWSSFIAGFVAAFVGSAVLGVVLGLTFFRRESADDAEFWNSTEAKGSDHVDG